MSERSPVSERSPRSVVFIGCGQATRTHAGLFARLYPDIRRSFASRTLARAEKLRAEFDGARAHGTYDEALAADEHDLALVATPPASHLELTMAALKHGKDVIVEKPPFPRAADVDGVKAAAEAAHRSVLVAENYFYRPLLEQLREVIGSRAIGDPLFLHVNAIKRQTTGDWRDDEDLSLGGALFEGGIHWISFMANLGLTAIEAHGYRPGTGAGPDRSMLVVFTYAEGAVGTLSYSWEAHARLKGLRVSRIYGTTGNIAFESNGLFLAVDGRGMRVKLPGPRDILGRKAMLRDFVAAIREDREPHYSLAHARHDLELIEQAVAVREQAGARA